MICRKCSSQMDLVQRTSEGSKVRLKYVCPRASCQETAMVVRSGPASGEPLAGEARAV